MVSEYAVMVNMNAKITLYVNARSEQEAMEKAEDMMYELETDTVLRPSIPDRATYLDVNEVHCTVSCAMET